METCEREKPLIKDLNEHIVCPLCRGYLVDATTLVECLHSFCRGCIVRRLSSGARACPACNVATSPPLLPDPRLQRLVYLLVPGLFRSELERRRHFRMVNPQCPPLAQPLGALDLTLDDFVSLSLCELIESHETRNDRLPEDGTVDGTNEKRKEDSTQGRSTRYLKCPAAVTVRHLVRLLMLKRGWEEANAGVNVVNRIEMMCEEMDKRHGTKEFRTLELSWTLLDLACIFGWKREAPMKLFYRILPKEETASMSKVCQYNDESSKDSVSIENIQRPPTPPPSPSPAQEREVVEVQRPREQQSTTEVARGQENELEREKETKTKKPRCEVTPVLRAPESVGHGALSSHHAPEDTKTKELARLEHRKRRKRRNKRVIAEITTTPREDLLKLKVRLTPCPPRITSSGSITGTGQTKEKLLQMRAVRREKMKTGSIVPQRPSITGKEEHSAGKESNVESEETIEEIIDEIPDEVVRIAQNINTQGEETVTPEKNADNVTALTNPRSQSKSKDEERMDATKSATKSVTKSATKSTPDCEIVEQERPKKDEEILRRLGLVAVNEAHESMREKTKQRVQGVWEKVDNFDREKLEKQLRESKANRVRSLLAEKQMRDALKSIMSKKKDESEKRMECPTSSTSVVSTTSSSIHSSTTPSSSSSVSSSSNTTASTTTTPSSSSSSQVTVTPCPKKKGPPPLAPLRVAKPSGSFLSSSTTIQHDIHNRKYETPLDLSNGGMVNDNALDLSATLTIGSASITSSVILSAALSSSSSSISSLSSSSSSPSSSSSSSPSSCPLSSLPFSRPPRAAIAPGNFLRKSKDFEQRRGQDTNLRTLSDAAVSLLGGCASDKTTTDPLILSSTSITASKVALRIPQPHQRISGFGMKIKPNLGVRHIPNPQAVVASQYRNQRASYFNAVSQQPP